jgi:small-conductance mechanosensitive channel
MPILNFVAQPLILILIAIAVGIMAEFVIVRAIATRFEQSGWRFGQIIIHALQGQVLWWLALLIPLGYLTTLIEPTTIVYGFLRLALAAGATYSIITVVVRILMGWVEQDATRQKRPTITLVNNLIKIIGAIIFILTLLSFTGADLTPLLSFVIGSSLGLSLALQNPLSNLFAGIQLILTERVRPGHYVKLSGGTEGYITDVRWTDTYIRTLTNNLVSVPNAEISKAEITNYELPNRELIIPMTFSVAADSNISQIEKVTLEIASQVNPQDSKTILRFHDMAQGTLTFTVYLRCHSFVEQFNLKHEFIKHLSVRYREEGIELA